MKCIDAPLPQSASQEAAFPVSMATVNHLNSLAAQLMKTEIQLYEKGLNTHSCTHNTHFNLHV